MGHSVHHNQRLHSFFKASELTQQTCKLHHVAPIPAYLVVHNHIDHSIDIFMVIDRLQGLQQLHLDFNSTNCKLVYKHTLNYCVNALASRTKKDITVTFPIKHFMGDIEDDANAWKQQCLQQQFPQSFATNQTASPVPAPSVPTVKQATKDLTEDETTQLVLKAYLANQVLQHHPNKERRYK